MHSTIYLAGLLLIASPALPAADAIQPLAAIDAAVRAHVAANQGDDPDLDIAIGRLDPRLRLPQCEVPLSTQDTHARRDDRPSAVEVRCEGSKPWALYVSVVVQRYAEVVVAARPIARGSVIAADDLGRARQRVGAINADYFTTVETVVGQVATRAIGSGQVLGSNNLKRPQLVRRGDQVVVTTAGGNISVSVRGTALADGGLGDRVTVRNLSSERVVEGIVNAQGAVVVRTGAVL